MTVFHYLPILTTTLSLIFSIIIYRRYRARKGGYHLLWWSFGVLIYGAGTFAESWFTLVGWNPFMFKFWYIVGALLGGAPLAQGTVWLLLKPVAAKRWTIAMVVYVVVAAVIVSLSPINYDLVNFHLPSGKVLEWQWVRLFSPVINLYAVIFLIGGAMLSAWRFYKHAAGNYIARDRFLGNCCIAVGAILPGFGGIFSRLGHTEYLYLGEVIGIIFIWIGYWLNIRHKPIRG